MIDPLQDELRIKEDGDDVYVRPIWPVVDVQHTVGSSYLYSLQHAIKALVDRRQQRISNGAVVLKLTSGILQMLDKCQNGWQTIGNGHHFVTLRQQSGLWEWIEQVHHFI